MSLVDYAAARQPVAAKRRTLQFSPGLWLAVSVMLLVVLAALFPTLFTQASPIEGVAGAQRLAPQAGHWLGTDQLGRDLFARIIYGASHSLSAAVMAVAIGLLAGTALGLVAGAIGGKTESIVMRAVDVLLAIPALLLSLSVLILLGFGTLNAALAVALPPSPASPDWHAPKWCASVTVSMSKRLTAAAAAFSACCGVTFFPMR